MASQVAKKTPKGKSKRLNEQLENKESGGGCRKILWDILTLRVLVYVLKQPPSCMFIVTLFVIAGCLPFIGLYISKQPVLPDLDAMQNWNAYIGKLGQNSYCFEVKDSSNLENISSTYTYPPFDNSSVPANWTVLTTCVRLEVDVSTSVVLSNTKEVQNVVLVASLTGKQIGTQIKSDGRRIDEDGVFIHIWIHISPSTVNKSLCSDSQCTVNGSVYITAPSQAVPTRLPQVHEDFSFKHEVINCETNHRCPETPCSTEFWELAETVSSDTQVANVTQVGCSGGKSHWVKVVNKHKFGTKVNGIIRINLSESDRQTAAYHMYLASVALAALSLTFTIGILLTDRPPVPKSSVE